MKIDRLKIILLAVILTFIFLSPLDAFSSSGQYTLQVPIGSVSTVPVGAGSNPFGDYFKMWYGFIIGTVGILATIMIIVGGFQWLSSRGNSGAIKEGQDRIFSAIIGLGIAFLAYTILNLVNPGLTNLDINTSLLKTITYRDNPSGNNMYKPTSGAAGSAATAAIPNGTGNGNYYLTPVASQGLDSLDPSMNAPMNCLSSNTNGSWGVNSTRRSGDSGCHGEGRAVDIQWPAEQQTQNGVTKEEFIGLAQQCGFTVIDETVTPATAGGGNNHFHLQYDCK